MSIKLLQQTTPTTVHAVQWTGTHEALRDLQTMLFPKRSPLFREGSGSIGVYIGALERGGALAFADKGSWIVSEQGGAFVAIYDEAGFRVRFGDQLAEAMELVIEEEEAAR